MREKIISILKEISPENDFKPEDNLIEDGILDSFDIVTLVTSLDEEFGISINGTDILPENFDTISSIEKLLHTYLNL